MGGKGSGRKKKTYFQKVKNKPIKIIRNEREYMSWKSNTTKKQRANYRVIMP